MFSSKSQRITSIAILGLRLAFQNVLWSWNSDIEKAIIPGLQCWYCQPSQAPYGIMWHLISYPLSLGGSSYLYTLGTSVGDVFAMSLLKGKLLPVYSFFSFWIWLQAPYDIPILWLSLFGLYKWPLAFLGILGKLPVGGPYSTWNFVLQRHYIASDYQYYFFMGVVFLSVLAQSLTDSYGRRRVLQSKIGANQQTKRV